MTAWCWEGYIIQAHSGEIRGHILVFVTTSGEGKGEEEGHTSHKVTLGKMLDPPKHLTDKIDAVTFRSW